MIRTNLRKITLLMAFLSIIFFSTIALAATEPTVAPDANNITVQNNVSIADTVKVSNLSSGDIVKVYDIDDNKLVQATALSASVTIKIPQLGMEGGIIKVSVTSKGKLESDTTEKSFAEEAQSTAPAASDITIANNAGIVDTVQVTDHLSSGDIVKVYNDADKTTKLGQATAYSTSVTVKIAQLGSEAGTIHVTVTSRGKLESDPTPKYYEAEIKSEAPAVGGISVINKAGQLDTVTMGLPVVLQAGDVMKVYSDAELKVLLGQATVATGDTNVTVRIRQLGSTAGSVFITLANKGKGESDATEKDYAAEAKSGAPTVNNVTNNVGMSDTVTVTGTSGDVVKVYSDIELKVLLGQATVAASGTATVRIKQLGSTAGKVYVTIASTGQGESDATEKDYAAEAKSTAPAGGDITAVNNVGISDTVTVTSAAGNVIKVYSDAELKVLLGQTTVAEGAASAAVRIKQLGSAAGSLYVTITSTSKGESDATKKDYLAEAISEAPDLEHILIINNPNPGHDLVIVYGLASGDTLKVYSDANVQLGVDATVALNQTQVVIDIPQLGISGGTVYITRTSGVKLESSKTQKAFLAE